MGNCHKICGSIFTNFRHKKMKRPFQFPIYLLVSVIALGVDLATLWALTWHDSNNAVFATLVAYGVGLIAHYFLSVRYVFAFRRLAHFKSLELLIYAATGVVGAAISAAVVYSGALFGLHIVLCKAIAVPLAFIATYLLRTLILFTSRKTT